uniref:Nuclear receptor subfamily 1 group I member 3 n=1 Tax=Varanus komodoensis TaxID=61221 RepID=A0A8D2J0M2_VARKO
MYLLGLAVSCFKTKTSVFIAVLCPSDGDSSPCILASSRSDTDPESEEKTCAVCGDRATGYHFHVMTCEGCKGFFRRTVIKDIQFTCPFSRNCSITKAKRRQCQACRYEKCLSSGMRKDMIMSEAALRERRALRQQKHQQLRPTAELATEKGLTAEQEQLIGVLTEAHKKNFDSSFSQFVNYQTPVRLSIHSPRPWSPAPDPCLPSCPSSPQEPMEEVLPDVFSMLPLFADLSTYMIQQVIQFAKAIPSFRCLPIDDQISLLKGSALDVSLIQFNTFFDEETMSWACGPHCYTIKDGALAGFQQVYLESLLKFHISLKRLCLHETEYILLQALVLFYPEHPNILRREEIDRAQDKIALTLKRHIDQQHPPSEGRFLFAKLVLLLTELQTLKAENTRQILHFRDTQNLTSMTPLLSEIIS